MKVMITTNRGLEDVASKEIKDILGVGAKERPFGILGRVMFDVGDIMDATYFTYLTRTANRVTVFLEHIKISRDRKGLEELYKSLYNLDWEFLKEYHTFAVRTDRFGVHEYNSMDIMRVAGQAIIDSIKDKKKYRQRVSLEDPDIIIRVDVIGNEVLVGIDLVGEKALHRRGYKIYHHPAALKTTLAQQLVILSEWSKEKILLDPMCGSGTIPIEAGIRVKDIPGSFWRKKDLQFTKMDLGIDWIEWMRKIDDDIVKLDEKAKIIAAYRIFRHIKGSEINAQKALVKDIIQFRRIDLEWLDLKIGEKEVDYIITNPPYGIRLSYREELKKIYKYLFYQADYILDNNGKIVLITPQKKLTLENANKYKFELIHKRKVWNGNLEAYVFIFQKCD